MAEVQEEGSGPLAVPGVFFTCPLTGATLSREQREAGIREAIVSVSRGAPCQPWKPGWAQSTDFPQGRWPHVGHETQPLSPVSVTWVGWPRWLPLAPSALPRVSIQQLPCVCMGACGCLPGCVYVCGLSSCPGRPGVRVVAHALRPVSPWAPAGGVERPVVEAPLVRVLCLRETLCATL